MPTTIDTETLTVTGMTCGSCKRRVENALTAVPGVADARVDVAGSAAVVAYDPATVTPERLIDAVRAAGYAAEAAPARKSGLPLAATACSCCAPR
jgi:Cu+-exporting ATPase